MKVGNIIHLALKQLGVLATGESASADDVADGVDCLKMLLAQWTADKLYVYRVTPIVLSGRGRHDVQNIHHLSDVALLDGKKITLIRDSNLHSFASHHDVVYGQVANGFWVQMDKGKRLELVGFALPTQISPDDTLDVPDNYQRALVLSLALEIAPMYGVEPSPMLLKNHASAIHLLKRANSTPFWAKNDLPVGLGGGCGCFT